MRRFLLSLGSIGFLLLVLSLLGQTRSDAIDLREAYKIAAVEARKWDEATKPYFITSVDDPLKSPFVKGADGTRCYWNFDFVVEDTNRHFIVTIHNNTVVNRREAESTVKSDYIIRITDFRISTADAVTIARKNYGLLPGKDWAQGYHFVLENDGSALILSVIGLDKNGSVARVRFNAKTGEVFQSMSFS